MVALLPWPPVPSDLLSFTGSSEIKSMKKLEFRKKKKKKKGTILNVSAQTELRQGV